MIALVSAALLGLTAVANWPGDAASTGPAQSLSCIVMNPRDLETRPSPLDSLSFSVGGKAVKVCYGRPSSRGRTMIGGEHVPYGKLWRTGANEPTMIHTTAALSIAGIEVEPGSYSLYTIPGESDWVVIVNRSITQWGHESRYTEEVKAQEVGRGTVRAQRLDDPVETFTIRAEAQPDGNADLALEWEHTRVRVPIKAIG